MSVKYYEKFGTEQISKPELREFLKRPGKRDGDGNLMYVTEQSHKDMCDINKIIAKYDRTGLITHVSNFEAKFGDMTGIDFKIMQDKVASAQTMFNQLPVNIRNRFDNDAQQLLLFMDDSENRQEAIELGLIHKDWTPETDGLGEHVKKDENVKKEAKKDSPEGD